MRELTLHARVEIGLLTALLLSSCNDSGGYVSPSEAYDVADVARANSVNALSRAAELEARVTELELELANLTDTVNNNAEAQNSNRDVFNDNAEVMNRALDRLERVERRLGM